MAGGCVDTESPNTRAEPDSLSGWSPRSQHSGELCREPLCLCCIAEASREVLPMAIRRASGLLAQAWRPEQMCLAGSVCSIRPSSGRLVSLELVEKLNKVPE